VTTSKLPTAATESVPDNAPKAGPAIGPEATWYAMPVLSGALIRLRPLAIEDAPGYLAAATNGADHDGAAGSAEVFRWMNLPSASGSQPVTIADAQAHILAALAGRARGERLAFAQIDVRTETFAGTTSFYDIGPSARTLAIGHTWLGRPWWRTGHNTESKLLLLSYAFEELGAARIVWHTDIYNTRSQAAIARLGATKEGVLRKHRIRRDGSWRDTVQYAMTDDDWPAAKAALTRFLAERNILS
jgi:RimJ/RimL family protein N-acetyltransferase